MHRRTLVVGILAAAVGLLAAGPASASTLRGTVVHKNRSAHKFVLATASGRLVVVRSTKSTRVGRVVRVSAVRRAGTWRASSIRTVGSRRHARLRGTVTYASRDRRAFTISTKGASVLVHQRRSRGRTASAASDTMPAAGEQVAVDSTIDSNDDLEADDVKSEGQDSNGIELEGKLLAVDQAKRQLTVAADDDDQSGGSVTVDVPDSFDLNQFQAGNEVELKVTKNADGTYTLTKAESDDENDGNDDGKGDGEDNGQGQQQPPGDNHGDAGGNGNDD